MAEFEYAQADPLSPSCTWRSRWSTVNCPTMILVEFSGQILALTEEEFEIARSRGLKLMALPRPQANGEILDAGGMEDRTGIPASWWQDSARKGTIPSLKFGKYVRFDLHESLEAAKK